MTPAVTTLRLAVLLFALTAIACAAARAPGAGAPPQPAPAPADHLVWARRPTYVVWREDGHGIARNRSVCSSFVSRALMRAYGLTRDDLERRFGTRNPQAKDYYAALIAQRGFAPLARIDQFLPGDIVGIAYQPGSRPTGHVVILASTPVRRSATTPIEPNTRQYAVSVIDSSASYHGFQDTRYLAAGARGSGVGRGVFRLYAGPDGKLTGYAWSARSDSLYYPASEHRIAVGRYSTAAFQAAPATAAGATREDDAAPTAPER